MSFTLDEKVMPKAECRNAVTFMNNEKHIKLKG